MKYEAVDGVAGGAARFRLGGAFSGLEEWELG